MTDPNLLPDLRARGLIHQTAEHEDAPLAQLLETPQTVYAGFDPTASSLHVGNLIPLLGLRRFQLAGHRPIVLAGGATGMVGDPSGKSAERNLLDRDQLKANLAGVKVQLEAFLDLSEPSKGLLVDNLDWTEGMSYLAFLRDVGKHFTINAMMRKDSVKARLARDSGEGISYTEFSYMLLQAHDFLHLYREHGCAIQVGGSDQWGNITAGTELIRRVTGGHGYAVTFPLLTNSDGSKFGKTAKGAVWLDPERTSPFAFRQFWFNTPDADLLTRLHYFTFLPTEEIAALQAEGHRAMQLKLAQVMTALVHGEEVAAQVETAAKILFDKAADWREMPAAYLEDALEGAPVVEVSRAQINAGLPWIDLVSQATGESKSKARQLIKQNSVALNGQKRADLEANVGVDDLLHERYLVIKKGKKDYFLVRVSDATDEQRCPHCGSDEAASEIDLDGKRVFRCPQCRPR